jgi:hypothetical protein
MFKLVCMCVFLGGCTVPVEESEFSPSPFIIPRDAGYETYSPPEPGPFQPPDGGFPTGNGSDGWGPWIPDNHPHLYQ